MVILILGNSTQYVVNSSNRSHPHTECYSSEVFSYVEIGILLLLMPCILIGNITVLMSMVKFRKLRTCLNLLLANLAVGDLLVGFPTAPLYAAMYISKDLCGNKWLCLAKYTAVIASFSCTLITLAIISMERYLAVFHPLYCNVYITKKRVKIIIGVVWFCIIPISIMPLLGLNTWDDLQVCEYFELLPNALTIIIFILTLGIGFPIATILFTITTCKIRKVQEHVKTMRFRQQRHQESRSEREKRAGIMMAFVFLLFVIFWLPFVIVVPFRYLLQEKDLIENIKNLTVVIAMGNSAINPIVYCWCKSDIRKAMYSTVLCKQKKWRRQRYEHNGRNKDIFHVL